jgi:hypothetical protein
MADITLCTNMDCPIREHCKRADRTQISLNQAYQRFEFESKKIPGKELGYLVTCDFIKHKIDLDDKE